MFSAHRVALASFLIAVKVHNDVYYPMSYYGEVGGIPNARELTSLEFVAFTLLRYNAWVSIQEVERMRNVLFPSPPQSPLSKVPNGAAAAGGVDDMAGRSCGGSMLPQRETVVAASMAATTLVAGSEEARHEGPGEWAKRDLSAESDSFSDRREQDKTGEHPTHEEFEHVADGIA